MDEVQNDAVTLATELTIAWLSNPNTRADANDVPAFLATMHQAVTGLSTSAEPEVAAPAKPEFTPAVTARKSLASPDHIISMIDGKPYKMLRRHLSVNGLTPQEYRARYNLKADYPMVAEAYAAKRRDLAKKIGLGRIPRAKAAAGDAAKPAATSKPKTRGRPKKAEAAAS